MPPYLARQRSPPGGQLLSSTAGLAQARRQQRWPFPAQATGPAAGARSTQHRGPWQAARRLPPLSQMLRRMTSPLRGAGAQTSLAPAQHPHSRAPPQARTACLRCATTTPAHHSRPSMCSRSSARAPRWQTATPRLAPGAASRAPTPPTPPCMLSGNRRKTLVGPAQQLLRPPRSLQHSQHCMYMRSRSQQVMAPQRLQAPTVRRAAWR
jgi:hypothetical protein